MKIFDLHNDALTGGGKADSPDTIYAVWTTELSYERAASLLTDNPNIMLAVEDCEKLASFDFPSNILYVGLTWNGFNGLAGGAYSSEHLTSDGRKLIGRLNEKKISVDTAHLNRASFFEVAGRADKIICSHTCFNEVNSHPRNLTSEQICAIIQKGGLVGLCCVTEFLGGTTIDDVVRHIDWFTSRFGDNYLALGTDFYGTTNLPEGLTSYAGIEKLALALIKHGYSDKSIQKIFYLNAYNYFNKRVRL